jgi:LPXTG-site transpeptidase (sortase) family protein
VNSADIGPEATGPMEDGAPPEGLSPGESAASDQLVAADQPMAPDQPAPRRSFWRRRSWKRWLADMMIVAGVLLLAYPLGTWGYTWYQQRELRQELESSNPQMAVTGAALAAADFIPIEVKAENAQQAAANSAEAGEAAEAAAAEAAAQKAREEAAAKAEAERLALVTAFNTAADEFERSVGGQTGAPIGEILIPAIGMDVVMVEGTGKGDLREGPGHWPETPLPGQGGNFVVSGHRTTYGAPFLKLNKVEVGDEIDLVLPYAVARYTVTRVIIVYPDEVEEVAQLGREQVSLAACHPLYSAKQRIVVQGDMVGFKLVEPQG